MAWQCSNEFRDLLADKCIITYNLPVLIKIRIILLVTGSGAR